MSISALVRMTTIYILIKGTLESFSELLIDPWKRVTAGFDHSIIGKP